MLKEKLLVIAEECAKRRIHVEFMVGPSFRISGFSKSGTVDLYLKENKIICHARYDKKTEINSFDDLAQIAFDWFVDYKDREPFTEPDSQWLPYFLEKKWINTETKTVYNVI